MRQAKRIAGRAKWLLLVLLSTVLWAPALVLVWGQNWLGHLVEAGEPTPDMSIQVKGGSAKGLEPPGPLSPPAGCNTKTPSGNNCGIPVGGFFTVSVHLNSIAGLTDHDEDGTAGYSAVQVQLDHDLALAVGKNRAGTTELGPGGAPFWPDCSNRDETKAPKGPDSYMARCDIANGADESDYTGLVMEQDYACTQTGKYTITLKHGSGDSFIVDEAGNTVLAGSGVERIVVACQPPKQAEPADTDGDGCSDQRENGLDPQTGGQRDYLNFWDFYDVWTHPIGDPSGWERNGSIDLFGDIFGVANRFGAAGDPNGFPLAPPSDETGYHSAFDRGALIGPNPWDMGPADGSIDLFTDIFGVAYQFGHDCT